MDVFKTRGWADLNLPLIPLRRLRRGDVVLTVHGTRGDGVCLPPSSRELSPRGSEARESLRDRGLDRDMLRSWPLGHSSGVCVTGR